jgi:hypothetical protein
MTTWYAVHISIHALHAVHFDHEAYRWSGVTSLLCIYFVHSQYCGIMKLVEMLFTEVLYAFSTLNNCHYTITGILAAS